MVMLLTHLANEVEAIDPFFDRKEENMLFMIGLRILLFLLVCVLVVMYVRMQIRTTIEKIAREEDLGIALAHINDVICVGKKIHIDDMKYLKKAQEKIHKVLNTQV